ncbi:MAG TPA: hypothetical protein VHB97_24925 [Polyangia bacterium]|nr:hypothetical protein [Polyangia bacterium]
MTRIVVVGAALAALLLLSCDSSFFLRGTINGDCDPPRTIITTTGGSDVGTLRKSNCQPMDATCCRRSAQAGRTSCQYPEDCYVAPYQGACATAVDCADTQTCMAGTCQCIDTGPACEDLTTHVVTCCAPGQACIAGSCGMPLDGGT